MILDVYRTESTREWRWRLRANNGRTIGASSEGFKRRSGMWDNLFHVTRIRVPMHWKVARLGLQPRLKLHVKVGGEAEFSRVATSVR